MSKFVDILNTVINPVSGKSLAEENRILSAEMKGEYLHVKYSRDGIDVENKKQLESLMSQALKSEIEEDNIFLLPQSSKNSEEVYKSVGSAAPRQESKPAQLKVGHGQVGEKKPIPGVKNIISIGSGKGGVGKSTFTSNLAVTLSKMGYKVGVIDADIYGPSMPMMFNRRDQRPQATDAQKIIPLENYGVKFISFGSFIHEDEPVVWRGPMLGGVLNQFFFDTEWGELDYLLLDLPPGTGDVQLSMIQNVEVDGAIIISTPQDIALLDSRKALHMFDKLGLHVIGMVENMSSFICDNCDKEHFLYGTGGVNTACGELGVGYLGGIPLDINLRKGADFGKPYMANEKFEGAKISKHYQEIAGKIDGYFHPGEEKKKGLLSKIFNKDNK